MRGSDSTLTDPSAKLNPLPVASRSRCPGAALPVFSHRGRTVGVITPAYREGFDPLAPRQ